MKPESDEAASFERGATNEGFGRSSHHRRSLSMVQAIPSGYAGVTPYLIVRDAAKLLDFYKKAFGATEVMRLPGPDGKIGHAEIKIGEGMVMLADEMPEMGHK